MSDRYRPSIRHAFTNWRHSDLPFLQKVLVTARNEWRKARTLSSCCGHIDEPGC